MLATNVVAFLMHEAVQRGEIPADVARDCLIRIGRMPRGRVIESVPWAHLAIGDSFSMRNGPYRASGPELSAG